MTEFRGLVPVLAALALTSLGLGGCGGPEGSPPLPSESGSPAGPYLGQSLPGGTPTPFAPGLVSTGYNERDLTMLPDGSEIYWGVVGGSYGWSTILMARSVDGSWSEPEVAPCCTDARYVNLEPHVTPDGQHFLWLSDRPGGALQEPGGQDIWAMDREADGWGDPYPLPDPVNTPDSEYFPSATLDGTLYFTRGPAGGGENLIFRSRLVDGEYQAPELLPEEVNSGVTRYNAFVDPEERFLILGVVGRDDALGGTDYYIVFRDEQDQWSEPVNLGSAVNTEGTYEYSASVSPDGKALFFMTARPDWERLAPGGAFDASALRAMGTQPNNGSWDIYWMSAAFLEELRPAGED